MRQPLLEWAVWIMAIFISASLWSAAANGTGIWPAATQRKLACPDVRGKDLRLVKLMKNEIYARHGKSFQTDWLREYFAAQPWYAPDSGYTDSKLTKLEIENAAFLAACQKTLEKGGTCCAPVGDEAKAGIVNAKRFGDFAKEAQQKIARDGFVVLPGARGNWEQFFHVYENNDYLQVPSFITSDSILHTFHIFFDFTLRQAEEKKLLPALESLTDRMLATLARDRQEAVPAIVKTAATRNEAFLAVGYSLLHGKPAAGEGGASPLVQEELRLISAAAGMAPSPIMGTGVDYSMFKPRGHYTRSADLKRFFMAMMWYGTLPFNLSSGDDRVLVMAALITRSLYEPGGALALWETVYEPTKFYVGIADDLTPHDVWEAMENRAPTPKQLSDSSWLNAFRGKLLGRSSARVIGNVNNPDLAQPVQFRFMGQRYTPDGEVFQNLTKYPERLFPRGLDLMAALGIGEAEAILREVYKEGEAWPAYWGKLGKERERLAGLAPEAWKQNLYFSWIHVLKRVNEAPAGGAPPFRRTQAWKRKSLMTSLGSWAELRHDTILYAKQSGAECGGGDGDEEPKLIRGYVEPNPWLYTELGDLVQACRVGLNERGLLTQDFEAVARALSDLLSFMKDTSVKELKGEKLSDIDYQTIRIYGATLDYLTTRMMTGEGGTFDEVAGPDRSVAVIADIHRGGDQVLEEAVGNVQEIYVVVPIEGKLYLTRGAVFSYYEFKQPVSKRLSDEEWQKMLRDHEAPPLLEWTDMFRCDGEKSEMPVTEAYSSGC
ncbi:MAG: DUF3160 domain-containing protein [Candidatus Aminicenantes bacterium]|nr:DUF3160 domain-containing protein [Candidatus Aminicenantes bacterium]